MLAFVQLTVKRIGVAVLGFFAILVLAVRVYPFWEKRLPFIAALFLTWIIGAYGLFPLAVRIMRLISKPTHIPLHTVTPDGFACDPINIGIVGSLSQIRTAMKKAGWYEADPRTVRTLWKMGISILTNRPYNTAPFSSLYLFGRKQDIGFQMPVDDSPRNRHHVRFWLCDPGHIHGKFWLRKHDVGKDKQLWVGAATQDIGLAIITHNLQITHAIMPDTNTERDFLVTSLKKAMPQTKLKRLKATVPYTLPNRVRSITMIADGQLTICEI